MSHACLQGRSPALPQELLLPDGECLLLEQWLRVLPDQRYVARAQWQGRTVLAKLFVGPKALRNLQRELKGVQELSGQQLQTPQLLLCGQDADWGGWVLFEFLDGAQSLAEHWQSCAGQPYLSERQQTVLQLALQGLAQMHQSGLWQDDAHLDNFLLRDERLYIIDGGGIAVQTPGQPLDGNAACDNLAVFFAQLPAGLDSHLQQLVQDYRHANGAADFTLDELRQAIRQKRRWRVNDYLKKTARDCSLFSVRKSAWGISAAQRSSLAEVLPLLDSPDVYIEQGQRLKDGGTATVSLVENAGKKWIIKRYNIKSFGHWLGRCWRPSRAWHSWQAAHRLDVLGIPAMQAVAVKEQRILGLRHTAWLISGHSGSQDLVERFAPHIADGRVPESDLQRLAELLNSMIREKISHGDLKGHNILWHNGRPVLIDLDAVRAHRCPRAFRRAFSKDRARLLRNWPKDSPLYKTLDSYLPQADAGAST